MHPFLPSSNFSQKKRLMGSVAQPNFTDTGAKKEPVLPLTPFEFDVMILVCPFQIRIFCDSIL